MKNPKKMQQNLKKKYESDKSYCHKTIKEIRKRLKQILKALNTLFLAILKFRI